MQVFIFILAAFVLSISLHPVSVLADVSDQQSSYFKLTERNSLPDLNQLKFNLNSYQYVVSEGDSAKQENAIELGYDYLQNTVSSRSKVNVSLHAQSGLSQQLDVVAPEIYYKYKSTIHTLGFGRQYTQPSGVDETFNLGLIHPYFTQDYLQYTHQGLMGFEYEVAQDQYSFLAGYYPMYLPNQEPLVKIEQGKALPQNRWSRRPPAQFVFNNQTKDINYSVNSYDMQDIVNNPSFRLASSYKFKTQNPSQIQLGYKYGPLPQIVIDRQTYADLDATGNVNFLPAVNYSNTFHVDYTLGVKQWALQLSALYDRPEQLNANPGRSLQQLSAMDVQSLKLAYQIRSPSELNQSVYVAYALVNGGGIKDLNFDGSENIFTFTKYRQQYFKPFKVGAELSYYAFLRRPQTSQIEWIYDQVQQGSVLSFEQKFEIIKALNIKLGMDVLGVETGVQQNDDHFINKYKSNDRFYSGLNYVY